MSSTKHSVVVHTATESYQTFSTFQAEVHQPHSPKGSAENDSSHQVRSYQVRISSCQRLAILTCWIDVGRRSTPPTGCLEQERQHQGGADAGCWSPDLLGAGLVLLRRTAVHSCHIIARCEQRGGVWHPQGQGEEEKPTGRRGGEEARRVEESRRE
eukprot:762502-Hanusia_phi.AAC.2